MLKINNIVKVFNAGTVNEKTALNGLSLHLEEGDFCTVIGGNGAGKSTMLERCGGRVARWIEGTHCHRRRGRDQACQSTSARSIIGRVFQDPMTGTAANHAASRKTWRWPSAAARSAPLRPGVTQGGAGGLPGASWRRSDLGLEDRLTCQGRSAVRRPAAGADAADGERLQTPKLLLLDEHTAALDPATAAKVLEVYGEDRPRRDQLTALMITHNMTDAIAPRQPPDYDGSGRSGRARISPARTSRSSPWRICWRSSTVPPARNSATTV